LVPSPTPGGGGTTPSPTADPDSFTQSSNQDEQAASTSDGPQDDDYWAFLLLPLILGGVVVGRRRRPPVSSKETLPEEDTSAYASPELYSQPPAESRPPHVFQPGSKPAQLRAAEAPAQAEDESTIMAAGGAPWISPEAMQVAPVLSAATPVPLSAAPASEVIADAEDLVPVGIAPWNAPESVAVPMTVASTVPLRGAPKTPEDDIVEASTHPHAIPSQRSSSYTDALVLATPTTVDGIAVQEIPHIGVRTYAPAPDTTSETVAAGFTFGSVGDAKVVNNALPFGDVDETNPTRYHKSVRRSNPLLNVTRGHRKVSVVDAMDGELPEGFEMPEMSVATLSRMPVGPGVGVAHKPMVRAGSVTATARLGYTPKQPSDGSQATPVVSNVLLSRTVQRPLLDSIPDGESGGMQVHTLATHGESNVPSDEGGRAVASHSTVAYAHTAYPALEEEYLPLDGDTSVLHGSITAVNPLANEEYLMTSGPSSTPLGRAHGVVDDQEEYLAVDSRGKSVHTASRGGADDDEEYLAVDAKSKSIRMAAAAKRNAANRDGVPFDGGLEEYLAVDSRVTDTRTAGLAPNPRLAEGQEEYLALDGTKSMRRAGGGDSEVVSQEYLNLTGEMTGVMSTRLERNLLSVEPDGEEEYLVTDDQPAWQTDLELRGLVDDEEYLGVDGGPMSAVSLARRQAQVGTDIPSQEEYLVTDALDAQGWRSRALPEFHNIDDDEEYLTMRAKSTHRAVRVAQEDDDEYLAVRAKTVKRGGPAVPQDADEEYLAVRARTIKRGGSSSPHEADGEEYLALDGHRAPVHSAQRVAQLRAELLDATAGESTAAPTHEPDFKAVAESQLFATDEEYYAIGGLEESGEEGVESSLETFETDGNFFFPREPGGSKTSHTTVWSRSSARAPSAPEAVVPMTEVVDGEVRWREAPARADINPRDAWSRMSFEDDDYQAVPQLPADLPAAIFAPAAQKKSGVRESGRRLNQRLKKLTTTPLPTVASTDEIDGSLP